MFDLLVLVAGVLLTIRGWRRGLLRQLATLLPFLLGLLIAVRLTPSWASAVEDWLGIPYEAGLLLVGLALFGTITFGGAAALHALARVARLPGLNTADRAGGAIMGIGWLLLGVMALVWFASFLSLPSNVTTLLSESNAVELIAGPDSTPRRVLDALTRDSWHAMLTRVEELPGSVDGLLRDLLSNGSPAQS